VDGLLETLQEEEWKDEEDWFLDDVTSSDVDSYNDSKIICNEDDLSILDQILAMVLGTLPIVSGTTIGEHYSFLKGGTIRFAEVLFTTKGAAENKVVIKLKSLMSMPRKASDPG